MIDLEQIRGWASEAVEMAKQTGLVLDYTRGSIGALERELDVLRLNERDDAATWDLACRFGAYLGEVMLGDFKEYGYEWGEDYDGEPILVSSYSAGDASLGKILPITKCNKYLLNGPSESTAKLYAMCLSHLKGGDASEHLASLGVEPSQLQGMEPAYVRAGRFDANAAAWLLYKDYVFFRLQEISWDGTTHKMLGAQVNAAKINEIPTLVANTSLLNGLLDLMTQLEKDEGLRVPLFMIHPGVQDAIRNEDLTGITLFNLMAQAQALIIKESEPNHYAVMCDRRLPQGIPAFYQLVARMIWDMRAYNERSGAYEVVFANARNFDADAVLGQVNEMVPGAFSNAVWKIEVTEKPQVALPSEEEALAFEPSQSDDFEPFITFSFDDEEEAIPETAQLEQSLNSFAREFPFSTDIEGTGYMDRVARIEHVRVGDPLVLAGDWENQWFDPACIEVFSAQGETLGNLSNTHLSLYGHRELACLLPYITATVESVTPKSKRRKNAKYALMDVRMELDPSVLGRDGNLIPEVIEEAKALFDLPRGERIRLSKGGIVASQLKGSIDVSKAHDVPNPIGSTFHANSGVASSANTASIARPEAQKLGPEEKPSKQIPTEKDSRESAEVVRAVETVGPEEATRRRAAEEAARRADELELEAAQGMKSVLNAERDGLLVNTPLLSEGFNLAYADKPGEPFALRTRAERLNATMESTLSERNRFAAERHVVFTKLVYAIKAMIDKRAAEEARLKAEEEARRLEEGRKRLLSLPSLFERIRSLAGEDRFCSISNICKGYGDPDTISKAKAILDEAWHQRAVRKKVSVGDSFYALGWSGNDWIAACEKENARLKAEHDARVRESLEALGSELNEKIEDNGRFLDAIRRYASSYALQKKNLLEKIAESRSKLNLIQESLKAIGEEAAGIETELSNAGFFAFRRKGELREALGQVKKRGNNLRKEEMSEEERITSLEGELACLDRTFAALNREIEEIESVISTQKLELARRGSELPDDAKDRVCALMKLYAYPVDTSWCVEYVPGVNDEDAARAILDGLVKACDAIRFDAEDTYALTIRGPSKHELNTSGQTASNTTAARAVSAARINSERLAKEVYRCLPYTPKGHTVKDIVEVVPEILTTQKASAVMRVAVEMGLFLKVVEEDGDKKIVRYRRQARR